MEQQKEIPANEWRLIRLPEVLAMQLPENASLYATRDVSARIDQLLKGDDDVDHWSTNIGQGAVRFYLPLNVQLPNDFFAQAVVVTKGLEQRQRVKAKLEQAVCKRVGHHPRLPRSGEVVSTSRRKRRGR